MMTYIIVLFGVFALCLVLSSFFVRVEKAIRSAPDGSRPRATMLEPLSEAEGKPFLEEEGWSAVRTIDESLSTRVYEAVTGNGETVAVKQVHLPSLRASVERRWYYSQGNFNLETPQTQEHHCLFGFLQDRRDSGHLV